MGETAQSNNASGKTHLAGQTNADSLLGRLVVERGLASPEDIQTCLEQFTQSASQTSLGDMLVKNGVITARQLERLRPLLEDTRPTKQIPGYQIMDKLGAGAMATVYKAKQISLDRIVAIKVLPPRHNNNNEFVDRFYAEGRAAAKLNHPNIVQAIDVGKAGDFNYFVMEYVEGQTVFDVITSGKRFSEPQALELAIQITRALDHAHKAGFIHRDVKPKNIMITKEGIAKLADMGLARAVSDREAAEAEQGKAYGTPYYISPEQVRGELHIDFRADIYSLGATLYHMVTGQVPFDGPNPSAVMHKHLKSDLIPPDRINAQLSAGICEIVEVCMAKDRNQRYNTTADLLTDLLAVAKGEPPVQARQKFDIASLSMLAKAAPPPPPPDTPAAPPSPPPEPPIYLHPLFFVSLAGWIVAIVLAIVYLVKK